MYLPAPTTYLKVVKHCLTLSTTFQQCISNQRVEIVGMFFLSSVNFTVTVFCISTQFVFKLCGITDPRTIKFAH